MRSAAGLGWFRALRLTPSAPVPQVWEKRLGPFVAPDRWTRHGRGIIWWLIWLDDGEPVLALQNASDPSSLDLLFADELHRGSFDQLPTLEQRHHSVLEQSCLRLLTSETAVEWQTSGLAAISVSGPLFPTIASVSYSCMRVALQGDRLMAGRACGLQTLWDSEWYTGERPSESRSLHLFRPIWSSTALPCCRCWDPSSTIH